MPTMGCTSFVSTEFRPSAGAVVAALPGLLLASGAALEDDVYIMSHGITHAIILIPTMPTMSPAVSYSHIVPDLSTHASALALLHRACDTIDAALLVQSGAVLVVSSRAPAFGGVAGAAGAAYLVRSGRCASLAEAIDRCCNPQAQGQYSCSALRFGARGAPTHSSNSFDLPAARTGHVLGAADAATDAADGNFLDGSRRGRA